MLRDDHQTGSQPTSIYAAIVTTANLLLASVLIVGGVISGSLALIADAIHNISDVVALGIALVASQIARRRPSEYLAYEHDHAESIAALVKCTALIMIGLLLLYQGGNRLLEPPAVNGWVVLALGSAALAVELITARLAYLMTISREKAHTESKHTFSVPLVSAIVAIGGALIVMYDWQLADPLITILIALYILYISVDEMSGVVRNLALGSPTDIDTSAVIRRIQAVDGVASVHHAHFWTSSEDKPALDAHIVVSTSDWLLAEAIRDRVESVLILRFGIEHSTLELETADREVGTQNLYGQ